MSNLDIRLVLFGGYCGGSGCTRPPVSVLPPVNNNVCIGRVSDGVEFLDVVLMGADVRVHHRTAESRFPVLIQMREVNLYRRQEIELGPDSTPRIVRVDLLEHLVQIAVYGCLAVVAGKVIDVSFSRLWHRVNDEQIDYARTAFLWRVVALAGLRLITVCECRGDERAEQHQERQNHC